MRNNTKILAAAAVLALAIAAFAMVPAGDSDAASFEITDVQPAVYKEKNTYVITLSAALTSGSNYVVLVDGEEVLNEYVPSIGTFSVFRVAYDDAFDGKEHVITVTSSSDGSASYTINAGYAIIHDGDVTVVLKDGTTVASGTEVPGGTVVIVNVAAKAGYIAEIAVGDEVIADGSEYTVTADVEFKAEYTPETYTVTIVDGCVEIRDEDGKSIGNGGAVHYGQTVTLEPIVPEGKKIVGWISEGLEFVEGDEYVVTGDVRVEVFLASDGSCSTDIVMGMRTTSDGNVKVILAADDAKAIPSGTVTVTMSYAMVDEYGIWDIDSVEISAEVSYTSDGYRIITVILTDNEYYPYATGLVASFTDGDSIYDSNKLQFTPLATARC